MKDFLKENLRYGLTTPTPPWPEHHPGHPGHPGHPASHYCQVMHTRYYYYHNGHRKTAEKLVIIFIK